MRTPCSHDLAVTPVTWTSPFFWLCGEKTSAARPFVHDTADALTAETRLG